MPHRHRMAARLVAAHSRDTGDTDSLCPGANISLVCGRNAEYPAPPQRELGGLLPQFLPGLDERMGKGRYQRHSQHFSFPTQSWLNGWMQREAEIGC